MRFRFRLSDTGRPVRLRMLRDAQGTQAMTRSGGMVVRDRCYREVTPEGTRSILCDMHRDGGPDAVGEKCPYYCDQEGCHRAGLYHLEEGFYCAADAMSTLR